MSVTLTPNELHVIMREIHRWESHGVLPAEDCARLRAVYTIQPSVEQKVEFATKVTKTEEALAAPRTTVSQLLLSEMAVRTALYLGGFFILVAAFIIAALVEATRLPILGVTTLIFLAGSVYTLKRLPPASLVLFIIGSCLLPIDAQAIFSMLAVDPPGLYLAWAIAGLVTGAVWAAGVIIYRNWVLSLLAFLAAGFVVLMAGLWLDLHSQAIALGLGLVALGGVAVVTRLFDRVGKPVFLAMFILAQAAMLCLMLFSFGAILEELIEGNPLWVGAPLFWLVAAGFYLLSERGAQRLKVTLPWAFLAVACFGAAALTLCVVLSLPSSWIALVAFILGVGFFVGGELLANRTELSIRFYVYALYLGGAVLVIGAILTEIVNGKLLSSEIYLLASGLICLGIHLRKPRGLIWAGGLIAFLFAWFNLFITGSLDDTPLYPDWIFFIPIVLLLTLEMILYKKLPSTDTPQTENINNQGQSEAATQEKSTNLRTNWLLPILLPAGLLGLINLSGGVLIGQQAYVFLAYAAFFTIFALVHQNGWLGFLVTGSLLISTILFGLEKYPDSVVSISLALACLFYLVGWGMDALKRTTNWGQMLRWSGLIAGAGISWFALIDQQPFQVLGITLVATFFSLEGWRKRSVWYSLPACGFYYLAYLLALLILDIDQPQFYSIGAAVLGIGMHQLFLRTRNPRAALFAGVATILILLSTTYIQMVDSSELQYFLLLFFEALILLVYGIVMRSRSFFFLPILFLVVATITVTLTVLSGVPTAIVIGCTGIVLLGLGMLALIMRERLARLSERVGSRFSIW